MVEHTPTHKNRYDNETNAQSWSSWLTHSLDVRSVEFDGLVTVFRQSEVLRKQAFIPPIKIDAGIIGNVDQIGRLKREAHAELQRAGYLHNGKWNVSVGDVAERFCYSVKLEDLVSQLIGKRVQEPHAATYIGYLNAGEFLDFHVDAEGFAEVNLLLCLDHAQAGAQESVTAVLSADGLNLYSLQTGEALIFDGAVSPHARTPIHSDEQVILLSIAFNLDAPSNASRKITTRKDQ